MSEILDIVLDIEEAGKKAQELENLASHLEKISDTELDEILTSIQNAWKGDNATAFIKKGTTLAGNINTSAGQLRRIAETIRTIAKNLQAADAQAAATASKT
jgi:WXG100 family type VII secretion target